MLIGLLSLFQNLFTVEGEGERDISKEKKSDTSEIFEKIFSDTYEMMVG